MNYYYQLIAMKKKKSNNTHKDASKSKQICLTAVTNLKIFKQLKIFVIN